MATRKSAADLTAAEIEALREAILRLKARSAPGHSDISVYDQFAALHGAVMAVQTPTGGLNAVNFGHTNIGFLPWHRQYLREFEAALAAEVAGVTLPYWDWADDLGAVQRLFTPDFLSSRRWGNPAPVTDGVLQFSVPAAQRPAWWPTGVRGFRVNPLLEEGSGHALARGGIDSSWPPSAAWIDVLVNLDQSPGGRHPLWLFWLVLEQGVQQLPQTHNAGHRFIGGHMGGAFSPNDPIFWLHHGNVDRLWDAWQRNRIAAGISAAAAETWPDAAETSPFDGQPAPEGHKRGDGMWPWLGGATGYQSVSVGLAVRNRLPDFPGLVRVDDVLDSAALGVTYQPPQSP